MILFFSGVYLWHVLTNYLLLFSSLVFLLRLESCSSKTFYFAYLFISYKLGVQYYYSSLIIEQFKNKNHNNIKYPSNAYVNV